MLNTMNTIIGGAARVPGAAESVPGGQPAPRDRGNATRPGPGALPKKGDLT